MPLAWMHIEKFGREVLIDVDHPLAVAQLAVPDSTTTNAVPAVPTATPSTLTTDTPSASAPAVSVTLEASGRPAKRRKGAA
jgi:hypothetical protein